jgi:hypothetical protein
VRATEINATNLPAELFCAGTVVFRPIDNITVPVERSVALTTTAGDADAASPTAISHPRLDDQGRFAHIAIDIVAKPSQLQLKERTSEAITLSWKDNAGDAGVKIYRWRGEDLTWINVGTVSPGTTQFTDTNVQCGVSYAYYVTSYAVQGESSGTPWIDASTKGCPLASPIELNEYTATSRSVTIHWQDQSDNEQNFHIYTWGGAVNVWNQIGTSDPDSTSFTDTDLACGTRYFYKVSAYNDETESEPSGIIFTATTACASKIYLPLAMR